MKKEEAILKINKLGKVSNVIVTICKILVILGIVLTIIGAAIMMFIPKDIFKMDMSATVDVVVDMSTFGMDLSEDSKEAFAAGLHDGLEGEERQEIQMSMDVNGYVYEANEVILEGDTVHVQGVVDTYTIKLDDLVVVMILATVTLIAAFVTLVFVGRLCRAFRDCESPFEESIVKNLTYIAYSLFPWVLMNSISANVSEAVFTNNTQINLGVDFGVIIAILLIFLLAYIFKYGAVLQQESDETL